MEHDENENKRSHRVCELCDRLIIGDREWAGRAQTGDRGAPGRDGAQWRDGAAPLWPDDPQLVILAFQGLFAAVCGSCATGTICQDSPLPWASPPSPAPSKHREHHTRDLNVASSSELLCLVSPWSFTTLRVLPQKARIKSLSCKIPLCK